MAKSFHAVSMANVGWKDLQASSAAFQSSGRVHGGHNTGKMITVHQNRNYFQKPTIIKTSESSGIHTTKIYTTKDKTSSHSQPRRHLSTYNSLNNFKRSEDSAHQRFKQGGPPVELHNNYLSQLSSDSQYRTLNIAGSHNNIMMSSAFPTANKMPLKGSVTTKNKSLNTKLGVKSQMVHLP